MSEQATPNHATWPRWRAIFLALGLVVTAACVFGPLPARDHRHLWALATQMTLLVSIVPVLFALGDPLGLVRSALPPRGQRAWDRVLHSWVVRALTFPAASSVLVTVWLMVFFFSGLLSNALHHQGVLDIAYVVSVAVGCLAALPMLAAGMMPAWMNDPLKLLFLFVDGLVDAIPGVVMLTTRTQLAHGYFNGSLADPNWDVHLAGGLMLTLSEVVSLPLFFIVFLRWASREVGRRERPEPGEPEFTTPWWEAEDSDVPGDGPAN